MRRYLFFVLLGIIFCWGRVAFCGEEFTVDQNTLFLAHFNTGIDADYAKGCKEHLKGNTGITTNNGGRYGEALICKRGMVKTPAGLESPFYQINFPLDGNVNLKKGTIEFWVKMDFPKKPTEEWALYYIVDIPTKLQFEDKNLKRIALVVTENLANKETGETTKQFQYFYGEGEDHHIGVPIDWKPEEWHHIAVTWDDEESVVFLDGEKKGFKPTAGSLYFEDLANFRGEFFIGGLWGSDDSKGPEGLIDEFRISSTVRYLDPFTP